MSSDELPPGFHFERYIDGPGLYYREHVIANASPANYRPNPPYRIAINPNSVHRRYEFTDTEEEAVRYMAAWARKWEQRIIEEVIMLNPPKVASQEPKEPPPQTTHPQRQLGWRGGMPRAARGHMWTGVYRKRAGLCQALKGLLPSHC